MKRIISTITLGVSAVILLVALNASQRRTAAAELALTESARAAAAEAASELEKLTLSLDKLLITSSLRQTAHQLSSVAISADRVQTSLASLPDEQGQQAAVLAYLSRLSHLAQTALADLAEGDRMEAETIASFADMRAGLMLLHAELGLAAANMLNAHSHSAALPASEITAAPTAQELHEYKSLPSYEVSAGEAMQLSKEFVGLDRVISVAHAPDTGGALPAYGVTVQTADVQLNLEITRRGGKVLLMTPETASFPMQKSVEECRAAAIAFLRSRGFSEMEVPYHQIYDGLCVLTCVYVQSGVLVWSDRVLVQVRMDTAEVVGIEARSYWQHHIPRKLQSPLLTASEARAFVSASAEISSARLCLLPIENTVRLCWQFTLIQNNDAYISYIDAMSGQELHLEKVMQLEFGSTPA